MTVEIALMIGFICLLLLVLISEIIKPASALAGGLVLLVAAGLLEPSSALSGAANEGVWTVALLFLVAGAVQQSGLLHSFASSVLQACRRSGTLVPMMIPVAGLSAFLNNTPVVMMLTPVLQRWCRERGIAPSKVLLPLSYAAIFGGTLTLIGTSTNLIIHGFMLEEGMQGFSMFELAAASLPAGAAGMLFLFLFGHKLLPERSFAVSMEMPSDQQTRTMLPIVVLVGMITAAALQLVTMFQAALGAAIILFAAGSITRRTAHQLIPLPLLVIIVSAVGIGHAVEQTGTAAWAAGYFVDASSGMGLLGVLLGIYLLTTIFTEVITNNAAAVLMFPIAHAAAVQLGTDPVPFFVVIAIAASASFATPIGYQTNLIVYEPGGYRFTDYLKIGIPLNLIYMLVTVGSVYIFWTGG
ncbi:SLC13 family permease [Alkalicoccus chagannorensis]|uniref:SLC13 family permease n=1 Tax=Alkalicoccus chagannorensis TaxID=427072 RepID=UPI00047EEB19|nr:SLC13 family permease [Alkalicoccus chagannorensis]